MNGIMIKAGPAGSVRALNGSLRTTGRGLPPGKAGAPDRSFRVRLLGKMGANGADSKALAGRSGVGRAPGKAHGEPRHKRGVAGRRGTGRAVAARRRKRDVAQNAGDAAGSPWTAAGLPGKPSAAVASVSATALAQARAAADGGAGTRVGLGAALRVGGATGTSGGRGSSPARELVPATATAARAVASEGGGTAKAAVGTAASAVAKAALQLTGRGVHADGRALSSAVLARRLAAPAAQTGASAAASERTGATVQTAASPSAPPQESARPIGAATGPSVAASAVTVASGRVGSPAKPGVRRSQILSRGGLAAPSLGDGNLLPARAAATPQQAGLSGAATATVTPGGGATAASAGRTTPTWSALRRAVREGRGASPAVGRRVTALRVRRAVTAKTPGVRRGMAGGQTAASIADAPGMFAGQAIASRQTALEMMRSGFVQPQTVSAGRFTEGAVRVLMSQVRQLGMTGASSMTVTLVPGNLGKLRFTVAGHKDGVLTVSLQADTLAAQHLLAQHAGELRTQLSGQGFREVTVDVGVGGGGASSGWQEGGGFAGQGRSSQGAVRAGQAQSVAYRHAPVHEGFFAEA